MKIKDNIFEKIIEAVCLVCMIGITIYLILAWAELPDKIPMHYDWAGNIDRWGNRGELIIMPIMLWAMYGFLTLVERMPRLWNTGVTVTAENQFRVYRTLKYMLKTLKLIVILDFSYLTIQPLTGKNMPRWFLPVVLVLVFGDIIFWLIRLARVK